VVYLRVYVGRHIAGWWVSLRVYVGGHIPGWVSLRVYGGRHIHRVVYTQGVKGVHIQEVYPGCEREACSEECPSLMQRGGSREPPYSRFTVGQVSRLPSFPVSLLASYQGMLRGEMYPGWYMSSYPPPGICLPATIGREDPPPTRGLVSPCTHR